MNQYIAISVRSYDQIVAEKKLIAMAVTEMLENQAAAANKLWMNLICFV